VDLDAALHRLWIGVPGTRLRDEDRKKSRELAAFVEELRKPVGKKPRVLVDAAAGKGYVGLLAAELLLAPGSRVVLIERAPDRVARTREAVARLTSRDVEVELVEKDVADPSAWPARPDLVVALHACGAATDAVIERAVACAAQLLYVVPCCTAKASFPMGALGIPAHASVRRAFTEAVVASFRTQRLEAAGYETTVAPLVPPTVTPYNMVWRARRVLEPTRMARAAADLVKLTAVVAP
jgi:NAD(P)-dependent dehydrogenase (short-subunit alcohol dehydrogenase family)